MIERIDHMILDTRDFAEGRKLLLQAGCAVTWDGPWESGNLVLFGVSAGPVNLEIIANFPSPERTSGVRSVAFDPGDIESTVAELRREGFQPGDPTGLNSMGQHFVDGVPVEARWRMTRMGDLLPGLSSFLCQYIAPMPHFGRVSPRSAFRFVELEVGVPNPDAVADTYQRVLGVQPKGVEGGYLLRLADTPIRLVKGDAVSVLLHPGSSNLPIRDLSESFPAIRWDRTAGGRG